MGQIQYYRPISILVGNELSEVQWRGSFIRGASRQLYLAINAYMRIRTHSRGINHY